MQCILNAEVCFIYAILVILVWGVNWGLNLAVLERTLFKPWLICLKLCTITYVTHAPTFMWPDFPFSSSFVGKRDMSDNASEEENMYLWHCQILLQGIVDNQYIWYARNASSIVAGIYAGRAGMTYEQQVDYSWIRWLLGHNLISQYAQIHSYMMAHN